jgi:aspartyl-tRNA(Asn)/glutamyl-tRNA(Gln) amidotransferase subunit A
VEVADYFLERIERLDPALGAFLETHPERTRAQAVAAQRMIDEGGSGPLTGVPFAIKDNLCTRGVPTTCASRLLEGYVPPYDATVVERANQAGLVSLGKTNLDEFAMGASNETSAFYPARNPWDPSRTPGGSSGGSAAAVSAGLAPLALGSDTGGSVRMPAALCGVVGFKPTYGRVSRYGLVAYGSSLDQVGPLARDVAGAAALVRAISGHDPLDPTTLPIGPIEPCSVTDLRGLRLALPRQTIAGAEPGVRAAIERAVAILAAEGASIEEVDMPLLALGVSTYYVIAPAEASSNLARFEGVRYGQRCAGSDHVDLAAATRGQFLGHEVKARIMIGTYALSAGYYEAYYVRAQEVRAMTTEAFDTIFERFDAAIGPTSPVVAFPLGSADSLALKELDVCTIPANLGGFPALSLPCGLSEGLPVGLQLMSSRGSDERLLAIGAACEEALPNLPATRSVS